MKKYTHLAVFLVALALPLAFLDAQEDILPEIMPNNEITETISEDEVVIGTTTSEGEEMINDPEAVVGTDGDGDLTAEEYEELISESEELTEEILDETEAVEGEIIAVNEEEGTVIIETADGDFLTVPTETVNKAVRSGGNGRLLNPKVGDSIIMTSQDTEVVEATVEIEENSLTGTKNVLIFIVTDEGKKQVSSESVPVYRNGMRSALSDVTEGDSVQVAQNTDGEVVAIYATTNEDYVDMDDGENSDDNPAIWFWLIGTAILVGGAYVLFRKKE